MKAGLWQRCLCCVHDLIFQGLHWSDREKGDKIFAGGINEVDYQAWWKVARSVRSQGQWKDYFAETEACRGFHEACRGFHKACKGSSN